VAEGCLERPRGRSDGGEYLEGGERWDAVSKKCGVEIQMVASSALEEVP
jgi:hypothetical protein